MQREVLTAHEGDAPQSPGILEVLRWMLITLTAINLFGVVVHVVLPWLPDGEIHYIFADTSSIMFIAAPFSIVIVFIFLCIWIYRLHIDLEEMQIDYPVTPRASMAKLLIPLYNIVGFWQVFKTMSETFGKNVPDAGSKVNEMTRYALLSYLTFIASQVIAQIVDWWPAEEMHSTSEYFMVVISYFTVAAAMNFVWLKLTDATNKSFLHWKQFQQ